MDWDARYRSGDTPWCKGRAHPLTHELIDTLLPQGFTGRFFVPGCGRGWDLAAISEARPDATIIGADLSASALEAFDPSIGNHPKIERISGDFLDSEWLTKAVGGVDVIWEHTCFCAIEPTRRKDYVKSAATILPAGGMLLGLFFLALNDGGCGPPWNCRPHELEKCFEDAFDLVRCELALNTFEGRHGEEYVVQMLRKA